MRAERAAALTNFLLILLIAAGLMIGFWPDGTYVYSNPAKADFQNAAMVVMVLALFAAPLAAVASWRTWVHAQRVLTRETTGWKGVFEAGALGFALTLPFVLPGVIARQLNPGQWGQPQALMLGVGTRNIRSPAAFLINAPCGQRAWLQSL